MWPPTKARALVAGLAAVILGCGSKSLPAPDGSGGIADGGPGGQPQDAAPGIDGPATPDADEPATPDADGPEAASNAVASAGCGKPAAQKLGAFVPYSVHVTGATLDPTYTAPPHDHGYAVWLPKTYDAKVPTRVVFVAEGCQSTGATDTRFVVSAGSDANTIYVGLDSPPASVSPERCWDNTGARSTAWEYFALVATEVENTFCVDRRLELVAGAHSGATLANMLGCVFSKPDPKRAFGPELALRAQLAIAGNAPKELPACAGPIAALWLHDTNEVPPPSESRTSLQRVLGLNGCVGTAVEDWGTGALVGAAGCKKYTGCPHDHPVVFCETIGRGRQSGYVGLDRPALVQLAAELQ